MRTRATCPALRRRTPASTHPETSAGWRTAVPLIHSFRHLPVHSPVLPPRPTGSITHTAQTDSIATNAAPLTDAITAAARDSPIKDRHDRVRAEGYRRAAVGRVSVVGSPGWR